MNAMDRSNTRRGVPHGCAGAFRDRAAVPGAPAAGVGSPASSPATPKPGRPFQWPRVLGTPRRRDLALAVVFSVLLHLGLFFSGRAGPRPAPPAAQCTEEEATPVELAGSSMPEMIADRPAEMETEAAPVTDLSLPSPEVMPLVVSLVPSPFAVPCGPGLVPPPRFTGVGLQAPASARDGGSSGLGGGTVFELAELDQPPAVCAQPLPPYPPELQRRGVTGEVVVSFIVDTRGEVRQTQVVRSTREEFERPALQAVNWWKFHPGKRAGRPVAVHMEVPIAFSLPLRG